MYRDPELPAGFQDADFEQAALYRLGAMSSALKRKGICDHGWSKADPGTDKNAVCLHCGKTFPDRTALNAERNRVLQGDY